jgi:hypothetical protein
VGDLGYEKPMSYCAKAAERMSGSLRTLDRGAAQALQSHFTTVHEDNDDDDDDFPMSLDVSTPADFRRSRQKTTETATHAAWATPSSDLRHAVAGLQLHATGTGVAPPPPPTPLYGNAFVPMAKAAKMSAKERGVVEPSPPLLPPRMRTVAATQDNEVMYVNTSGAGRMRGTAKRPASVDVDTAVVAAGDEILPENLYGNMSVPPRKSPRRAHTATPKDSSSSLSLPQQSKTPDVPVASLAPPPASSSLDELLALKQTLTLAVQKRRVGSGAAKSAAAMTAPVVSEATTTTAQSFAPPTAAAVTFFVPPPPPMPTFVAGTASATAAIKPPFPFAAATASSVPPPPPPPPPKPTSAAAAAAAATCIPPPLPPIPTYGAGKQSTNSGGVVAPVAPHPSPASATDDDANDNPLLAQIRGFKRNALKIAAATTTVEDTSARPAACIQDALRAALAGRANKQQRVV